MDQSELHAVFLEFESDLFEIKPQGIPIWEWMRSGVYRELLIKKGIFNEAQTSVEMNVSSYLKGGYLFLRNIVRRNPYFSGTSDFLFYGNPRRKLQSDGYWWDIYCDPIHTKCNLNYLQVESNYKLKHYRPARTENFAYLDFIHYTDFIKRQLGLVSVTLDAETKIVLDTAAEEFKNQFGIEIDFVSKAEYHLRLRKSRRPLYMRLLSRIDPELAVVICSYGKETFIECCKDQDIPVVELQHGIIREDHTGYSYPGNRIKEMFPDYLLTWGEFWGDRVEFPIPDKRVIPVGYPYLEQRRNKHTDVASNDQILLISQRSIGKELSKFALELEQHPHIDHDIVYKLHPGEYDYWEEEYPWLVDADFEVIDSSEPPLYELFAGSNIQVGVYSTAIYEGMVFNLKTFVYDCPGVGTLDSLIEEGAAELISSSDELVLGMSRENSTVDFEYFFESNATEEVCEVLSRLLSESQGWLEKTG
jgi:hypothetical protein